MANPIYKTLANVRSLHKADNALRAIEYAMQELVSCRATSDDLADSASVMTSDTALVAASCTYLSYDSLRELAGQKHLSHLSDTMLDEYAEEAD